MAKGPGFDVEYEEEPSFASEDAFSRITSYSISYSVSTLIDLIRDQELELEPEFQRNFVWDKRTASLFIDSLLIGFPTPNLFFGRNAYRDDFVVIDGLQRLKTLYFFIHEKFSDGEEFRLTGLAGRSWEGMSYSQLPLRLQRRLKSSVLNSTVVDDVDFSPGVVHELFYRINTGGIPLTDQEVRNCVYTGRFNRCLHELNLYPNWRALLGSTEPHLRLADIEVILRVMALADGFDQYRPPMSNFLSAFQAENRDHAMQAYVDAFKEACDLLCSTVPVDMFRSKGTVKRTLIETVLIALVVCNLQGHGVIDLESAIVELSHDLNRVAGGRVATTSAVIVRQRISMALDAFRGK